MDDFRVAKSTDFMRSIMFFFDCDPGMCNCNCACMVT